MPKPETVDRFIARVQATQFLEAIEEFYADDASMQENNQPPRRGKAALLANERKVLGGTRSVRARSVPPVLVQGDHVVVRWQFEFEGASGGVVRIDELAWQRWRGEQIVEEKFFYDPAQMKPVPAGGG
jgi:hypothetical protein